MQEGLVQANAEGDLSDLCKVKVLLKQEVVVAFSLAAQFNVTWKNYTGAGDK